MLHLKLTCPDLANPRRVTVAINESPGNNFPAEWAGDLRPGGLYAGSWGERGVAHLILVSPAGHQVFLEMTGLAALSLARALTQAAGEVWAAEQHFARTPAPDAGTADPDRLAS